METSTIRSGGIQYVKNFLDPKMALKEFGVLSFLFGKGISVPKPNFLNANNTSFAMQYIQGEKISGTEDELEPILKTMAKYHSIGAKDIKKYLKWFLPSYLDEGKLYSNKLGLNGNFKKMYKKMYDLSDCLVHNDLMDKNLMNDGKNIYFIDWGSAIYGMPQTDLVRIITTFGKLDTPYEETIKQKYNELNPTKNFEEKYSLAKDFQEIKLVAKAMDFATSPENKKEVQKSIELIREKLKC